MDVPRGAGGQLIAMGAQPEIASIDGNHAVAKLASGQYRGEFTRAAYGGAEVDQGLLYGFER
jgi:hypothetical protein